MITHQEAEILTSARQDAPLDPLVERELQAHLATCAECRAFAAATERLTAGLKSMPTLPASPRVRREVLEKTRRGRGPIPAIGSLGGMSFSPALATLAAVLLLGVVGWFAFDRVIQPNDNGGEQQIAAVPTEQSREGYAPPATVADTALTVEEPTATDAPSPTATDEPTLPPTEPPTPTNTVPPTDVPVPTETSAPKNVLVAPTETPATDRTSLRAATIEPTATNTPQPTNTPAPTNTPEPTATNTPEPTNTPSPTPSPSPTPTAEPTNTPGIEPIGSGQSTEIATTTSDNAESPPIEPADGTGGATIMAGEGNIDGMGGGDTQLIDGQGGDTEVAGLSLLENSVSYTGIGGDPSGHLTLTSDGRLIFSAAPDSAGFTTYEGYVLQSPDIQPGVALLCGDGFCEPALETPEDASWLGDMPLGVSGNNAWVMRMYSDRSEIIVGSPQGTSIVDPRVIGQIGPQAVPGTVYDSDGTLYAWLPSGEWLVMRSDSAQALPADYPSPYLVRFAPIASQGPLVGYFSGGTLVIAPAGSPGSAMLVLPAEGIDFDIQPMGNSVALIRGNDIVLYDMQGNEIAVFQGGDAQPGSLIWLEGGIVWVDRATGQLYQIPSTAP